MALEVVTQLLTLSRDPENRPFIVRNQGCLPGLVMFLENDNNDVVKSAVETLHNLACYEGNREVMTKEPGLLAGLRKLSSSDTASPFISSTLFALDPPRTPLRDVSSNEQAGLSLYSEKVANKLALAKTHTFYIKGMNNFTKHKVEESLIGVKGIISFLIDVHTHKAIVRTMTNPDVVISAIKESGLQATYGESESNSCGSGDDDKENEPDYLPEGGRPAARKGWGWGSIVSKGSAKKPDPTTTQDGQWGWNSVVKAIWG